MDFPPIAQGPSAFEINCKEVRKTPHPSAGNAVGASFAYRYDGSVNNIAFGGGLGSMLLN